MAHEVFISHSSQDKPVADAVTAALEQSGVRCWIAPRDIRPGASWGGAIVEAIEASSVMVVIFSAQSNASKQVMREVERAVQHDVVVVPFRIEDVTPSKDMEYFLSSTHWLDAMSPEMDAHLQELTKTVNLILDKETDHKAAAKASRNAVRSIPKAAVNRQKASKLPMLFGALALAFVLGFIAFMFVGGDEADEGTASGDAAKSTAAENLTRAKDLGERDDGDVKLNFSGEAMGGAEFDVTWKGDTASDDYIVLTASDAAASVKSHKQALSDKSALTFQAPDQPGDYQLRFFDAASGKIIARETLTVSAPEVQLQAPKSGAAGSVISVEWSGPNQKYDGLAIAEPGAEGREKAASANIAKGSPTDIRLPDVPGDYVLRYVSGGDYIVWKEQPLTVTQPEVAIIQPGPQVAGAIIDVEWQGPANKGEYLTVSEADADAGEYFAYTYVKAGKKAKLRMPASAGQYVLRYVSGQSKQIWAETEVETEMPEVSVTAPSEAVAGDLVKLDWQGPANKGDYVSIADPDAEANRYHLYKYVKKGRNLEIQMPEEPGQFELRYISGAQPMVWFSTGLTVLPRSEQINADDEVTAGEKFNVSWQDDGAPNQYIGIFRADAADDDRYESYIYTKNKTSGSMKAPAEPGNYELRYLSGGKKLVWARKAFTVIAAE